METIINGMRPIHPGEVLREEFLIPLGLTANALAIALQVPGPRINDVVRERRAVTVKRIADALALLADALRGAGGKRP